METEDEIRAAVTASMRTAIMLAAQIGERAARAAEQRAREVERAAEQQRRELTARLDVDRALALAQLAPVHDARWWDTAGQDDIAGAYAAATAWEERDSEARRAAERIRTEVRDRYGIDLNQPDAQLEVASSAFDVTAKRAEAGRDEAEAGVLLAAAVVAESSGDPDPAQAERQDAGVVYDSAQRREAMGAALTSEVGVEAAHARVTADKGQTHPPQEAVADEPNRSSPARTTRSTRGTTRNRALTSGGGLAGLPPGAR